MDLIETFFRRTDCGQEEKEGCEEEDCQAQGGKEESSEEEDNAQEGRQEEKEGCAEEEEGRQTQEEVARDMGCSRGHLQATVCHRYC